MISETAWRIRTLSIGRDSCALGGYSRKGDRPINSAYRPDLVAVLSVLQIRLGWVVS